MRSSVSRASHRWPPLLTKPQIKEPEPMGRFGIDGEQSNSVTEGPCQKLAVLTLQPRSPAQRIWIRYYVSAVGERIYSGYDEATRERDWLLLAGFGSDTASLAISADFDAERDRRLRVGVASDFPPGSGD